MPTKRQSFGDLFDMPDGLRKFVLSQAFEDADTNLQKTYQLTPEQTTAMGDAVMAAIYGQDLASTIDTIKQVVVPAALPEEKWKTFLADMVKLELWPIRELFGSELTDVLNQHQIGTGGWPTERVLLKPLSYSGAATETASMAGFTLMGPQMRERLRDLIVSKSKGVRTDAQVRDVLTRSGDFGGLGLDGAGADKTLAVMNNILSSVKVMSEDEYSSWLAESAKPKAEVPAEEGAELTEEDQEIAQIKAKMPKASKAPETVLEQAIDKTFDQIGYDVADNYLSNRLRHIISSRFRDVRTSLEVKQLLMRDSKVGGMSLDEGLADRLTHEIEDAYKTYHDAIYKEEEGRLVKQKEEQKIKIDERREREAKEHAKWYEERILAKKETESKQKELAAQMKSTYQAYIAGPTTPLAGAHPLEAKEQRRETERFGTMVPAAAAGATAIAEKGTAPSTGKAARPEVKVSAPTAKLAAEAPIALKPKMQDIARTSPKLVGPAEELHNMTLATFRRLSSDPEEAATKIMEKIDTLGQESFEKRSAGIKAWQQSPLQRAYVSLVGESFRSGKPVTEIAEQKRTGGEDTLLPPEVAAIISLNSKLHY